MASSTTKHAKIVVKPALALLVGQLTILTKLVGDGGRGSGGRRRFAGLVVVKLVFLVFGGVVVGVGVVAGVLVLVLIVRLLVFGFIGLGLAGTGFLPESFPVTVMNREALCAPKDAFPFIFVFTKL